MKLAEIFSDNMVLQREREICIFGTGKGAGRIELGGETVDFLSTEESFRVYLPPMNAGGPYDMKVTLDEQTVILKNIMIGDVYIASGQSNMEFRLKETADIEIKECEQIRFFNEPHDIDPELNESYNYDGWQICRDENAMDLSAIAYYFAHDLHEHTGVAVGIVSCNKGATRVDAWTAPEIVEKSEYQKMISVRHQDYQLYKFNHDSWPYINKLLPIVPFGVRGVLWYQGESNRCYDEGIHYSKMLGIMIENWRKIWNNNMPFYCVQIMPFDENPRDADWAVIRAQQEKASKDIENVYLTTLVNTGEAKLIHPTRKKEIAHALAKAVISTQHGKFMEYCGPVFDSVEQIENGIKISFTHADGLNIRGKYLEDTFVYDVDGVANTVDARIFDNVLELHWQPNITAKRIVMGYTNNPKHNLYNCDGYLASPFEIMI